MDVLERIEAGKEFRVESRHLVAQFESDKLRLKKWANDVGISDEKWKEMPDPRLRDRNLEEAVKMVLRSACEIFDGTQQTRSQLHIDSEADDRLFPDVPAFPSRTTNIKNKPLLPASVRDRRGPTIKSRGKFVNQVDIFRNVVDTLYDIIPPRNDHTSGLVDRINGMLPHLKWCTVAHLSE
jgi:hypothetical protein